MPYKHVYRRRKQPRYPQESLFWPYFFLILIAGTVVTAAILDYQGRHGLL